MKQLNPTPQPRRVRRGMALIEAMISLSLSATMLIAVSAAFRASARAVEINEAHFRCSQSARVTMGQMLTELRRADAVQVDPSGKWIQVIRPTSTLAPNELYRQFSYDATNKRVTLQIFYSGNVTSPVYEMTPNVSACTFGPADTGTDYNNTQVAVRVPITLTCAYDGNAITLSGAAAPRRAQQF